MTTKKAKKAKTTSKKKTNGVTQRAPVIRQAWMSDAAERKMVRSRKMFLQTLHDRVNTLADDYNDDEVPAFRDAVMRLIERSIARYKGL